MKNDGLERVEMGNAQGSPSKHPQSLIPGQMNGVIGEDAAQGSALHKLGDDAKVGTPRAGACTNRSLAFDSLSYDGLIPMNKTTWGCRNSANKATSARKSSIRYSERLCLMNRLTATSTPFHLAK